MTDDNISRAAVEGVLNSLLEDYREHGNDEGYAALEEALIDISCIRSRPRSPERTLLDENNALRAALAASGADCPFCGLPASDLAKCQSGFPGCARADDLMLAPSPVEGEGREKYSAALNRVAGRHRRVLEKIEGIQRDWSHGDVSGAEAMQRIDDIVTLALYGPDTPVVRAALSPQSPTGDGDEPA